MAYRQINTRSPFYVQLATSEPLAQAAVKIWLGDVVTDKPAEVTYLLEKETQAGQATLEISELVRDYCNHTDNFNSGKCWVEVVFNDFAAVSAQSATYLATEGYSLYQEGLQHNGQSFEGDFICLPESNEVSTLGYDKIYRLTAANGISSSFQYYCNPTDSVSWTRTTRLVSGAEVTTAILPTDSSSSMMRNLTIGDSTEYVRFNFNGDEYIVYHDLFDCNKWNNDDSLSRAYISGQSRPVTLAYVNKFGARNTIHFTLKHMEEISVSSESFNRNVTDYVNLNNGNGLHASRKRVTGSKQSFTINTDYLDEYYVKQLEELVLSEYVWARNYTTGSNYLPVNITNKKISKKNHLNDRLIQYTFTYESANEYINNVR